MSPRERAAMWRTIAIAAVAGALLWLAMGACAAGAASTRVGSIIEADEWRVR